MMNIEVNVNHKEYKVRKLFENFIQQLVSEWIKIATRLQEIVANYTSTKRIFIVSSKRHLSSGIEPTLTQETLIMTSV